MKGFGRYPELMIMSTMMMIISHRFSKESYTACCKSGGIHAQS